MKILQLKKDSERRIKGGHPWVFSNELSQSPKNMQPGEPAELRDASGGFVARGYGNPSSLIAFRALSRTAENVDPLSVEALYRRFCNAYETRASLGYGPETSFRLCFGEADFLPGLIVDRYALTQKRGQVLVIQAHTAGIDRALPQIQSALERWADQDSGVKLDKTAIVLRNDLSIREREGVPSQEPKTLRTITGVDLQNARIQVGQLDSQVNFIADLLTGQKTGFFLDQAWNAHQVGQMSLAALKGRENVRILDLFCYVGQWGSTIAHALKAANVGKVSVTAIDASADALKLCRQNLELQGAQANCMKADILEEISKIPAESYDLVICDPPALMKSKKDIPTGRAAYLKLATEALRIARKPGGVVMSSCSAHLLEADLFEILAKASIRTKSNAQWVFRGGHGPDHPVIAEFPEGRYLKTVYARVRRSE